MEQQEGGKTVPGWSGPYRHGGVAGRLAAMGPGRRAHVQNVALGDSELTVLGGHVAVSQRDEHRLSILAGEPFFCL